jgi:hypothetical protein
MAAMMVLGGGGDGITTTGGGRDVGARGLSVDGRKLGITRTCSKTLGIRIGRRCDLCGGFSRVTGTVGNIESGGMWLRMFNVGVRWLGEIVVLEVYPNGRDGSFPKSRAAVHGAMGNG